MRSRLLGWHLTVAPASALKMENNRSHAVPAPAITAIHPTYPTNKDKNAKNKIKNMSEVFKNM